MTELATAATALPGSDIAQWNDQHRALAQAMGLVFKHAYGARAGDIEVAPRDVIEKFMHVSQTTGLDPLTRQIYCIGRSGKNGVDWSIQTSIDGFRVIAERSGHYAGQDDAEWFSEKTGGWTDVWIPSIHGAYPAAARVRVYRNDWTRPASGVANWDAYAQTTFKGELTSMWAKMGPLMLAKCAEALALRKAFPQDLSGLYTSDEMAQAAPAAVVDGGEVVATPAQQSQAPAQQPAAVKTAPVLTVQQENAHLWVKKVNQAKTRVEALEVYQDAKLAGALGQVVTVEDEEQKLGDYIKAIGKAFAAQEALAEEAKLAAAAEFSKEDVEDAVIVPDEGDDDRPMVFNAATGEIPEENN